MRIFLLIGGLVFFSSFLRQDGKDVILWNEARLLTWDDFKGKPQKRFAAASTAYDILKDVKKGEGNKATVSVRAVFFCKTSWKDSNWAEETILAHEQKHFDIVELFSRKLRKLLQNAVYKNYKRVEEKADSLYAIIDKQMDVYHDKYDDETNGSMNGEKQREWNKKIMAEIKTLEQYKSPDFTLTYNAK